MSDPPHQVDLLEQLRSSDRPAPPTQRRRLARPASLAMAVAVTIAAIGVAVFIAMRFPGEPPRPSAMHRVQPSMQRVDAQAEYQAYSHGEEIASKTADQPPSVPAEPHPAADPAPSRPEPRVARAPKKAADIPSNRADARRAAPAVAPKPYRNGTMATHLTGEALRLALIEDRRITREYNEAALRNQTAAGGR